MLNFAKAIKSAVSVPEVNLSTVSYLISHQALPWGEDVA